MKLGQLRRTAAAKCLLALLALTPLGAQSSVLTDPGFGSGIEDWTSNDGRPEAISWDPFFGDLGAGSLKIEHPEVAQATRLEAATECFEIEPGTPRPVITASVFADLGAASERCGLLYVQHLGPNCTGERSFVGNTPSNVPGAWERRVHGGGEFSPSIKSAKIGLYLFRLAGAAGTATCHFDDVRIARDVATEVPLGPFSTRLLLGLCLAFAGLWRLRSA